MLNDAEVKKIENLCLENRQNILRMVHGAKSGHIGGSFSACEIMTVLFHKCMKHSLGGPDFKDYKERDRFILSKVNRRTLCGMAVFSGIYLILETKDILPKEGQTALLSTSQMGACALLIIGGLFLATAIIWSVISIIKERQRAEKHWR